MVPLPLGKGGWFFANFYSSRQIKILHIAAEITLQTVGNALMRSENRAEKISKNPVLCKAKHGVSFIYPSSQGRSY